MNYIDPVIIVLLAWSLYRGFIKGLVIMVAAFIALIIGIWGAARFSGLVGEWLANTLNVSSPYLSLVSFTITFICIVIAINIAAYLISRLLDAIALGLLNRLLGALFSFVTMALFLSVIFVVLNAFDQRHDFMPEKQIENSLLYQPVADLAPGLFPFLWFENIAREIENLLGTTCRAYFICSIVVKNSLKSDYPLFSPKGKLTKGLTFRRKGTSQDI